MPSFTTMEDAYTTILTNKIAAASAAASGKKFNHKRFRDGVMKYLAAMKVEETSDDKSKKSEVEKGDKVIKEPKQVFCNLLNKWFVETKNIKAAHLVPKCLESAELANMFGAREVDVKNDVTNGLMLHKNIEEALDKGEIVFVPIGTKLSSPESYKCMVVDKGLLSSKHQFTDACDYGYWPQMHNRKLSWNNDNRPAARFMYLKFITTYLKHKSLGTTSWVSEIESKGEMWATPGSYLRESMLCMLARKASDRFLPDEFYKNTTFTDKASQLSPSDEELAAQELALKLKQASLDAEDSEDSDDEN